MADVDLVESDADAWGEAFSQKFGMAPQSELAVGDEPPSIWVDPVQFQKGFFWLHLKTMRLYVATGSYQQPNWRLYRFLDF